MPVGIFTSCRGAMMISSSMQADRSIPAEPAVARLGQGRSRPILGDTALILSFIYGYSTSR